MKLSEFYVQKVQSGVQVETTNEKNIEISTPGYYLIGSANIIEPSEISTYYDQTIFFGDSKLIEVPEAPKEEVMEEPDVENPSTGIQDVIMGGGIIVICSLTGIYLIRKKKLFVK